MEPKGVMIVSFPRYPLSMPLTELAWIIPPDGVVMGFPVTFPLAEILPRTVNAPEAVKESQFKTEDADMLPVVQLILSA